MADINSLMEKIREMLTQIPDEECDGVQMFVALYNRGGEVLVLSNLEVKDDIAALKQFAESLPSRRSTEH